jgi:hypothetical protein
LWIILAGAFDNVIYGRNKKKTAILSFKIEPTRKVFLPIK